MVHSLLKLASHVELGLNVEFVRLGLNVELVGWFAGSNCKDCAVQRPDALDPARAGTKD
jgi:hypothetical protein